VFEKSSDYNVWTHVRSNVRILWSFTLRRTLLGGGGAVKEDGMSGVRINRKLC
jgi:hypothetical protein